MTKILLVEDDKSLREIYGVRLLAEGYDIISAGDGEEALAMAIKERPALIVSDVMMPKISGFDMLDILRSTTETKEIKVIMMTALSSEDQRKRGEQLGADRYLVKSQVGIEDVVRTVHEVLGDAPVSAAASAFSTPAPQATTAAPQAPAAQAPSTPPSAPEAPAFTQAQAAAPAAPAVRPEGVAPRPSMPLPTAQSQAQTSVSSLPQPTAPFSTPRPSVASSGRSLEPLSDPSETSSSQDTFANRLEQELQSSTNHQPNQPAPAPQPVVQPSPLGSPAPSPSPVAPATPPSAVAPTPEPTDAPAPMSPPTESHSDQSA